MEVRRSAPASGLSRWRRFRAAGGLSGVPLALAFCFCATLMDLWTVDPFPYRLNQYLPADIHARVHFKMHSRALIDEAELNARNTTPATFRLDEAVLEQIATNLRQLPDILKPPATQPATRPATRPITQPASQPPPPQVDEQVRERFDLKAEDLPAWQRLAVPNQRARYEQQVARLKEKLAQIYTVSPKDAGEHRFGRQATEILLAEGEKRRPEKLEALISVSEEARISEKVLPLLEPLDKPIRRNLEYYLLRTLKSKPICVSDPAATARDIERKIRAIEANPPLKEINADERIAYASRKKAAQGEQNIGLSADELEKLRGEHLAFRQQELFRNPLRLWMQLAGRAFILLLVTALVCIYIARYQPRIVRSPLRAFTLAAALLLMLAVVRTMVFVLEWNLYTVTLPVLMVAMVLAIAYDQRFAMAIGASESFFVVHQLRADFPTLLVLLAGVAAVVFPLREVRTRGKLILVSAVAAAAVFAVVWAGGLAADVPLRFALHDSLWSAGFALLVGFLVWGILPVIERIFGVATSMTLLEWSDASKPLLKRLAMDAPGTYNHSLQLAAMCESAAEGIGARGLLARVGAYYHDVGKINKPEYFTENQSGSASKHDKLSPAMSLLIITGHVKDGLELAREYALPSVLHEFVATHHGTTLVQYFYHQAAEQRKNGADRPPEEVEFRYHGPKPRSKEAAILLLADASESSVRSMADPTPGRIENQVHTMISRRLMDGQLDECELTLQEVHQIEASLVKTLCSIYHSRIAYPTPSGQRPSAAELRPKRAPSKPAAAE